jgi:hypothetical protein
MSMADITAAATAMTALQQAYSGKIAAIDAQVAAKKAEVDAFVLTAREKLAVADQALFDPATLYSKNSLNLGVDPSNPTQTVWTEMVSPSTPYIYMDYAENFASLQFARAIASLPGYSENPNFSNDYSVTIIDFVFFETGKTSQSLNDRLAQTLDVPASTWDTGATPRGKIAPIITLPNKQWSLCNPYIRFRNIVPNLAGKPAGTAPQAIAGFGGNTVFALQTASAHRK